MVSIDAALLDGLERPCKGERIAPLIAKARSLATLSCCLFQILRAVDDGHMNSKML
jgi:hypothetical protein